MKMRISKNNLASFFMWRRRLLDRMYLDEFE